MAIDWKPFSPKAIDFLQNSTARLCILHGSVRSSKTINCTVRWLTYIINGPPGDLFMVGRTTATLQRNVLNDLFDIVGPKNYKWVSRMYGELNVFNRRIYCVGANNEDAEAKIRGATVAGAYCDEANLYPESFWQQLMARMSVQGAQCFANCNPDSPFHWFYTGVIQNPKIVNKQIWHFTMDDNLSLDPEYVADLKTKYTGVYYRRFIEGEWCAADGLIYDMFDDCPDAGQVINLQQVQALKPLIARYFIGCDYGTSTVMSWSLFGELIDGRIVKVREYYYDAQKERKQKTDSQFGDEFDIFVKSNLQYPHIAPWAVYCDPSAASWKIELRTRGYNVQDAANDVLDGIRYVGSLLAQGEYLITSSCVNTIDEYRTYSWDPKQTEKGLDQPIKKHDHACDSDRYGLYTFSLTKRSGVYQRAKAEARKTRAQILEERRHAV